MPSVLIVWYDAACPLCQREIALMRKLDSANRIEFLAVQDEGASCPLAPEDMLARFHAEEDGQLLSGAAAFAAMWRAIPLLRPLGLAARLPIILRGLEWLYLRFLKIRPRLSRMLA
jgi:predicted DCC family thiol-disulfide oxidoreductase YuxK